MTCPKSRPSAASVEAAPSVGPTQGLQSAPKATRRELAGNSARRKRPQSRIRPIADRSRRQGEAGLKTWNHQHYAKTNERESGSGAEEVAAEPDGKADDGDKEPDRDERERQPDRQRNRSPAMLACRRPEHDRQQRQNTRR